MKNPFKKKKPLVVKVSKSLMNLQNERRKGELTKNALVNKARANMKKYNIHNGTPFYPLYINFINKTQGKPTQMNKKVKNLMNQTQNGININFKYSLPSPPRHSHKRAAV